MPFDGANPSLLGTKDGDGFARDHGVEGRYDRGRWNPDHGPSSADVGLGAEALLDVRDLVGNHAPASLFVLEKFSQVCAFGRQPCVLAPNFFFFQSTQLAQTHIEDGLGLRLAELKSAHELGLGCLGIADDADDLVQVHVGRQQSEQNF